MAQQDPVAHGALSIKLNTIEGVESRRSFTRHKSMRERVLERSGGSDERTGARAFCKVAGCGFVVTVAGR